MNVAYKYTVLTLSLSLLTHYTVATYIRPTLYILFDAVFERLYNTDGRKNYRKQGFKSPIGLLGLRVGLHKNLNSFSL